MSSKGQVVIPQQARKDLGLTPGMDFVVVWRGDVVMLKVISAPMVKDYDLVLKRLASKARAAGRTRKNVPEVIRKVRSGR